MSTITEEEIKCCLRQIESRLNRGVGLLWTNNEFEKLSTEIEDKTGVLLSVTTLKRIWGKVKYEHNPTLTTLNALAQFLNFEDWRSFSNSIRASTAEIKTASIIELPEKLPAKPSPLRIAIPYIIGGLLFLFAMSFLIFSGRKNNRKAAIN